MIRHDYFQTLIDEGDICPPVSQQPGVHVDAIGQPFFNSIVATHRFLREAGFTRNHPEPIDFLVFLTNFSVYAMPNWPARTGLGAANSAGIKRDVEGIGRFEDASRAYRSYGRLRQIAFTNNIHLGHIEARVGWFHQRIAHELAHNWIAWVRFWWPSREERISKKYAPSRRLLDSCCQCHWSRFLESGLSMMGWKLSPSPHALAEMGNGRFVVQESSSEWEFNDLDLYLMGLLSPDNVRPRFLLHSSDTPEECIQLGTPFEAIKKTVDLQDIVDCEGERAPSHLHSTKDFTVAFVLISRDNEPNLEERRFVNRLAKSFEVYWPRVTHGTSTCRLWRM